MSFFSLFLCIPWANSSGCMCVLPLPKLLFFVHFNPLCVCSGGEVSNAQFVGFQGHRLYIFVMQHWIKARIKRRQCVHRFVRWYQTFSSFLSGSFVSSHLAYYGRHFFSSENFCYSDTQKSWQTTEVFLICSIIIWAFDI